MINSGNLLYLQWRGVTNWRILGNRGEGGNGHGKCPSESSASLFHKIGYIETQLTLWGNGHPCSVHLNPITL